MIMHPFILDWVCIQGRIIPKVCFGFLGTFHRTVLLYYGCHVRKVLYVAATYSIKESFVCAVSAKKRDYVLLVAVLDLIKSKEESGPVTMYRLLGLLPDTRETD